MVGVLGGILKYIAPKKGRGDGTIWADYVIKVLSKC